MRTTAIKFFLPLLLLCGGLGVRAQRQMNEDQVKNLVPDLAAKAPLASPALTGAPTAPTPATADNSTAIATTAFVKAQGYGTGGGGGGSSSLLITSNYASAATGVTSISVTLTPKAGTALVLAVGCAGTNDATLVSSVSDGTNTWSFVGGVNNIFGGGPSSALYVAPGAAGIPVTITVTFSSATTDMTSLSVADYDANVSLSSPVDGFDTLAFNGGLGSSFTTNPVTTTNATDVLVVWGWSRGTNTITVAGNYASDNSHSGSPFSAGFGSSIVNSAGTYSANVAYSPTASYILTAIIALKRTSFSQISGTVAPAQLPQATSSVFGAVKPDGTTIIASGGVISAVGTSSGIFSGTLPTAAVTGFSTAFNSGAGTSRADTVFGQFIQETTGAGGVRGYVKTYPASPFTVSMLVTVPPNAVNNDRIGFVILNSLTTQLMQFNLHFTGSAIDYNVLAWSTPASFSSSIVSNTALFPQNGTMYWLRLKDNGTNVTFYVSTDGNYWVQLYTVAKSSSFLGSSGFNFVGIGVNETTAIGTTILAFSQTSP